MFSTVYAFNGTPDGNQPAATLIDVAGTLYGTTPFAGSTTGQCGAAGCGIVFSVGP